MFNYKSIIEKIPFEANGYKFTSFIGHGTYATVLEAIHLSTGHKFAAKIFRNDHPFTKLDQMINTEVNCLTSVLNPNIIKIYDHFKVDNSYFLILELCKGSIDNYINKNKKLTEQQILIIMKQLLNAVNCCHQQGIAHRDIKTANVLISQDGYIKLSDFGIAIQLKEPALIKNTSGSLMFKAPELINKEEHCPFKADIWSLGVTFFNIATGKYIWGFTKDEITRNIVKGNFLFPYGTPTSVVHIIKNMIVVDPSKRATANELLNSPFFKSINSKIGASIKKPVLMNRRMTLNTSKINKNLSAGALITLIQTKQNNTDQRLLKKY